MTRPNAELLTMPVGDSLDIADALDREIETVWGVIAALQWILTEHAVNPTSTVRYSGINQHISRRFPPPWSVEELRRMRWKSSTNSTAMQSQYRLRARSLSSLSQPARVEVLRCPLVTHSGRHCRESLGGGDLQRFITLWRLT